MVKMGGWSLAVGLLVCLAAAAVGEESYSDPFADDITVSAVSAFAISKFAPVFYLVVGLGMAVAAAYWSVRGIVGALYGGSGAIAPAGSCGDRTGLDAAQVKSYERHYRRAGAKRARRSHRRREAMQRRWNQGIRA